MEQIKRAGRAGDHRLVIEGALEVRCQRVGGLITPVAVFLQHLEDDPIEVAAQFMDQLL